MSKEMTRISRKESGGGRGSSKKLRHIDLTTGTTAQAEAQTQRNIASSSLTLGPLQRAAVVATAWLTQWQSSGVIICKEGPSRVGHIGGY